MKSITLFRTSAWQWSGWLLMCVIFAGCGGGDTATESGGGSAGATTSDAKSPSATAKKEIPTLEESGPKASFVGEGNHTDTYADKKPWVVRRVKRYSDNSMINHGHYVSYYQNEMKFEEGEYVEGKKQGPWHVWYKNGQEAKVENYVDGMLEGQWTQFDEKGVKESEVSFKANKRDGRWITYYEDGKQIKQQEEYRDGKLHGPMLNWFRDGAKGAERYFKDGQLDGVAKQWFPKELGGGPAKEAVYANGKQLKAKHWKENGEPALEQDFTSTAPAPKAGEKSR